MSYKPIEHLYQEELYVLRPKVLVIIPMQWDSLPEDDQVLLSKILTFVKTSLSSVQVLALRDADINDLEIYQPSRILAFGGTIKVLGKNIPSYQAHRHNGIAILQADSLDQLDAVKKKNLQNALKEMFELQS